MKGELEHNELLLDVHYGGIMVRDAKGSIRFSIQNNFDDPRDNSYQAAQRGAARKALFDFLEVEVARRQRL